MKAMIQTFIQTEFFDGKTVAGDEDLLLGGFIDSMGVMRLVTHIEQQLGMTVPPEDVTIENFASINEIARYCEARRS